MSTAMQHWLFLVHRIPSRPLYLRAKMLQRLTAAGEAAVAQFRRERDADYASLAGDAKAALKSGDLKTSHQRLTRRLEEIRGIDFFVVVEKGDEEERIFFFFKQKTAYEMSVTATPAVRETP